MKLANELSQALDSALDFYLEYGRRIPLLIPHRDMLQNSTYAKKFLGFIYLDLLDFQSRIMKLFAERSECLAQD